VNRGQLEEVVYQSEELQDETTVQSTTELVEGQVGYQTLASIRKQLGIQRDACYQRMKYLNIKPWKTKGRSQLDPSQVASMESLHDHIKQTGKMDGFPKPEPTGPWDEEEQDSTQESEQSQGLLETLENELDRDSILQIQPQSYSQADLDRIKRHAAEIVKVWRLTSLHVALAMQKNPSLLPEDIRHEIEQAEAALILTPLTNRPNLDPKALAQLVLQSA
jgi:hypothetical protein